MIAPHLGKTSTFRKQKWLFVTISFGTQGRQTFLSLEDSGTIQKNEEEGGWEPKGQQEKV